LRRLRSRDRDFRDGSYENSEDGSDVGICEHSWEWLLHRSCDGSKEGNFDGSCELRDPETDKMLACERAFMSVLVIGPETDPK